MQLCGRSENGHVLRLDPEHLTGADFLEEAYRARKHVYQEETRGGLKTSRIIAFAAWLIGRDPDMSMKYVTCRDEEAKQRNRWLQVVMMTDDYRRVFGDAAQLLQTRCNAGRTTVRGKTARDNPNFRAEGIEGIRSGPHYDILILDDVCDTKSSFTQAARKISIKEVFYKTLLPELDPPDVGGVRMGVGILLAQGTTYASDDLNMELAKRAKDQQEQDRRWMYRRVACGGPPDFKTPYPSILPSDYLRDQYEMNERAYEMNRMLIAVGDEERPFRDIRCYIPERWRDNAEKRGLWDEQCLDFGYTPGLMPSESASEGMRDPWFRLMAVDPGFSEKRGSSCTGIAVGALSPNGDIYVLHGSKKRQPWTDTLKTIPELCQHYRVDLCLFEVAGQQEAAFHSVEKDLHERMPTLRIDRVSPANRSKVERAKFIAPRVNAGRVYLRGDVGKDGSKWVLKPDKSMQALYEDMKAFPALEHPDLVDAFVYLTTHLRQRAVSAGIEVEQPKSFEEARWTAFRDQVFGREPEPGEVEEFSVFIPVPWAN